MKKYTCDGREQCHNRCTFEAMGGDEPFACPIEDYIENWIEEKGTDPDGGSKL